MDSLPLADFPLLSAKPASPSKTRNWSALFAPEGASSSELILSHFPSEPDIVPFSEEKLSLGAGDWTHCLVGYSIGRRPFYEALLSAIHKTWTLKGELKMLSLSDGFFLFRFSCEEDLDHVWSRGVWFLLGKPFILQKWHPKFKPKRENLSSVPIWIKIHDLPLACWNSEGISRIASKVGIPLAADSLTTLKSRLTYARVCVLVDSNTIYPEEIKVSLDGDVVALKVQYEWRPTPCEHCKSLVHYSTSCPSRPQSDKMITSNNIGNNVRGRSHSRNRSKNPVPGGQKNSSKPPTQPHQESPKSSKSPKIHNPHPKLLTNSIGLPIEFQPHSPTSPTSKALITSDPLVGTFMVNFPNSTEVASTSLPNLNSPMELSSSSASTLPESTADMLPPGVLSPNKYDILLSNLDDEHPSDKSKAIKPVNLPPKGKEQLQLVNAAGKKSARGKKKGPANSAS